MQLTWIIDVTEWAPDDPSQMRKFHVWARQGHIFQDGPNGPKWFMKSHADSQYASLSVDMAKNIGIGIPKNVINFKFWTLYEANIEWKVAFSTHTPKNAIFHDTLGWLYDYDHDCAANKSIFVPFEYFTYFAEFTNTHCA